MTLPDTYDPASCLIATTTEVGTFHESRAGARLARDLLAHGGAADIALAHRVLDATLACQLTDERQPRCGNFRWMAEDDSIGDLNAVEFCLEALIPLMITHGHLLDEAMQQRLRHAIRIGLDEIARLDVRATYTNIATLDALNSSLGGELLGCEATARRGYAKLVALMQFTDRHGGLREFNSPTYTRVCIQALHLLAAHVTDADTRVRARAFAARLGISVATHIHPATGRWAGPHSRAYHPTVLCTSPAELHDLRAWVADGALPSWTLDLVTRSATPRTVLETASVDEGTTCSTYMTDAFSLGVASISYGGQSNAILCHYTRKQADRPGVFFSRYLTNDKWLGDFYHATDRTSTRNLIDEGQFCGVQRGNQAIVMYTPKGHGPFTRVKSAFVWTQRQYIDEIRIGDQLVQALPCEVPDGETLIVASGDCLFAVRPLTRTDLGVGAPIRLVERAGDLVLEIHNYLGEKKAFWDMDSHGPFFKGHPLNGAYVEIAARSTYTSTQDFLRHVSSGTLTEHCEASHTFDGRRDGCDERLWTVEYRRSGERLGIELDLMRALPKRRWHETGDLDMPMLRSPFAVQSRAGSVQLGGATAESSAGPLWLVALPEQHTWVVGYHGPAPAAVSLSVPGGRLEVPRMSTGTLAWQDGQFHVDASGQQAPPIISRANAQA